MVANENAWFRSVYTRGVVRANGASNPDHRWLGWLAVQIL